MFKRTRYYWIKWCISPTLLVSDFVKSSAPTTGIRGKRVKRLNKIYLGIACLLLGISFVLQYFLLQKHLVIIMMVFAVYCISRCNEIFFAFIKDAFDKLDPSKREANGLAYYERVQMALRSYLELVINYAILFYVIDAYSRQYGYISEVFNKPFVDIVSALYFSVITIVAIGYGDICPIHPLARILVCYEVMTGILLLVVSFTIYVNLSLSE